ncbi:DUF4249 domain-containing protein [Sabulibacter ruber]|uniref:DUF4249 domain-containing protein n=1 Tax=Sabulibacter ruber TaxID=2811901 RepID=UPI001F61A2D6|nr:DUF4249 domain-containing protein [Sabulibacter ruber]
MPEISSEELSLLVVEGSIQLGQSAVTTIKLSRTIKTEENLKQAFEKNARVYIEGKQEVRYLLEEQETGTYRSSPLNLSPEGQYRIRIETTDGKEYLSDYVEGKITPPIDKVHWKWDPDGLRIYVNSHDPSNATRYYQWEFEETWQINSPLLSYYKFENGEMVALTPEETFQLAYCWNNTTSKDLILGTTTHLVKDTIEMPLVTMAHQSAKTQVKYSILVKQHALTKTEYEFLDRMKKNSNAMGSFFDPQPSETRGNITCVSAPDQLVVGYIGAYTWEVKRIYIKREELPGFPVQLDDCSRGGFISPNHPDSLQFYFSSGKNTPLKAIKDEDKIIGYSGTLSFCADCRVKVAGSSLKPDWWE